MVQLRRRPSRDRTLLPSFAPAILAVAALALGPQASSQPHMIPTDLMTPDTIAIVRIDLTRISARSIQEAILAAIDPAEFQEVVGTEEGAPTLADIAEIAVSLPFLDPLNRMVLMGSDLVWVVVLAPRSGEGRPASAFALTKLADPANEEGVRGIMAGFGGSPESIVAIDQIDENDEFDRWLVVPLGGQPVPQFEWSPAREERFGRAFASMGDHAVTVAFASNLETTDTVLPLFEAEIPGMLAEDESFLAVPIVDVVRGVLAAPYSGFWLDLGQQVSLRLLVELEDPDVLNLLPFTYGQIMEFVVLPRARRADEAVEEEKQRIIAERVATCREAGKEARTDDIEESTFSVLDGVEQLVEVARMEQSGSGSVLFVEVAAPEMRVVTTWLLRSVEDMAKGLVGGLGDALVPFVPTVLESCVDG